MKTFLTVTLFSLLCLGANSGCEEKQSSLKDKSRDGFGQLVIDRGGSGNSDVEVYVITLEGKKFAVAVYQGFGVGITQIMEK
jgi:hypothetical protein